MLSKSGPCLRELEAVMLAHHDRDAPQDLADPMMLSLDALGTLLSPASGSGASFAPAQRT